jgi:hypothetical protein
MPTIKIHVEHEELAAIKRRAEAMGVKVEDLAYGALSCSMSNCKETFCTPRIARAVAERGTDLPLWSDTARSVGVYESKPDAGQERGPKAAD